MQNEIDAQIKQIFQLTFCLMKPDFYSNDQNSINSEMLR